MFVPQIYRMPMSHLIQPKPSRTGDHKPNSMGLLVQLAFFRI